MHRRLLLTVFVGALAPAHAQDPLYRALGARPGLERLVDDLWQRLLADAHMNPFFKDLDAAQFKRRLTDQLCEVAGGPCRYDGPDMKKAHSGVDITRRDFNALVELLQQSMQAQGLPFGVQNRLLARLAPMHREVINLP
jgi:hemoglobin